MKHPIFGDGARRMTMLAAAGAVVFGALASAPANAQNRWPQSASRRDARDLRTLTGVVTRDLRGDDFELRGNDGRTYRVRVGRFDEPRSLSRGDRVQVSGRFEDSNVFVARTLDFLRDGDRNDRGDRRMLTGVVTRDLPGDDFELRGENGRVYRVRVGRYQEPRSLDRGDRVRVTGRVEGGDFFLAQNLEFLRDTPGNSRDERTLTGVVTRDLRGDDFEMRGSDGRTYVVRVGRFDEPRSLSRGDRVRVIGRFEDRNVFVARSLEMVRDRR